MPLLRALLPNYVTTTRELGQAMLTVAREGYLMSVPEPPEIRQVRRVRGVQPETTAP